MKLDLGEPLFSWQMHIDKLNKVSIDSLVAESLEILKNRKKDADGEEIEEEEVIVFKKSTAAAYKRLAKATKQRKRGAVKFEGDITPIEA